jgi:hypothetical protein
VRLKYSRTEQRRFKGDRIEYIETKNALDNILLNCWFTELREKEEYVHRTGLSLNIDAEL